MVENAQNAQSTCPYAPDRNDSKSAAIAAARSQLEEGAEPIRDYKAARKTLLDKTLLQGGGGAGVIDYGEPDRTPVFYLDGPDHAARRARIAPFFTHKAVTTRYNEIIEAETARLVGRIAQEGRGTLDELAFELTVSVVANIVGLTNSDVPKMARRLDTMLSAAWYHTLSLPQRVLTSLRKGWAVVSFWINDVSPALRARRTQPSDDLLSQLLAQGASRRTILMECMTYAAAGMVTTREFIVMAAWHLLERDELRQDFLDGDPKRQLAILNEILRLETIAAYLYRRTDPEISGETRRFGLDLRAIHNDEEVVGACPHALDPDRKIKGDGSMLAFGAGSHHCPGKQVALHESRLFLDALLRLPGIRLERAPDLGWSDMLMGYELRNCVVACDPR